MTAYTYPNSRSSVCGAGGVGGAAHRTASLLAISLGLVWTSCDSDSQHSSASHAEQSPCTVTLAPSSDDQSALQGALIDAVSGDTICLKGGRFKLTGQLTLAAANVTVHGNGSASGINDTVLDFSAQESGANGLEISADHDTLDSLRIEDPKGDGVRATAVDYVTFRNVHVEWTAGPDTSNGGYGIYPVSSSHVLVEHCYVSGASDTGVYVGQSHDIIIRDNEVTGNVAGIEIENSTDAEVYRNHAHGNTGGILVFNLPGLEVKDGKRANVHDNVIEDNNLENFAPAGGIIASLPAGTGMFILASDDNELHDNTIQQHQSQGISILSWVVTLRDEDGAKDREYDWFPERNNVHDNRLSDNGATPQGASALIAGTVGRAELADLIWDGVVNPATLGPDAAASADSDPVPPEDIRNCFTNNGDASFLNLDIQHDGQHKSTDVTQYACTPKPLPALEF